LHTACWNATGSGGTDILGTKPAPSNPETVRRLKPGDESGALAVTARHLAAG
jgi:hypothetical protein